MKKIFVIAIGFVTPLSIYAQTPPASFSSPSEAVSASPVPSERKIDSEKEKLIRSVLARTKEIEMAQERIAQGLAGMKQMMTRVPEKFWEKYRSLITPEELRNRLVQVYDRHYTTEELKELLQFYDSPLGKKLSDKAVPILRDSIQVSLEMSRRVAAAVASEMRTERLLKDPRGAGSFNGMLLAPRSSPAPATSTPTPTPQ